MEHQKKYNRKEILENVDVTQVFVLFERDDTLQPLTLTTLQC